ncbi:post-GPI attachment to proteins factor 6-like [Diadema antillarum]|uniref:post-GPI attachment to proteins factor 6-like n=1 Tax=Diadema antillarum TaxID=105358 RepID=UPI003A839810
MMAPVLYNFMRLLFVLAIVSGTRVHCTGQFGGEQQFGQKLVREYEDYGNVALFRFRLPEQVTYARWYVRKFINHPEDCEDLTMMVAVEAGSLPVINPYNFTFPEDTILPTDGAKVFPIPPKKSSLILEGKWIQPGDWFIAVYRLKQNNKIQQKGLSTTCHYSTKVGLVYTRLSFVQTLGSGGKNAFSMGVNSDTAIFKFLAEPSTSSLSFKLDECQAWSHNKSLQNHCPLQMYVEDTKLPSDQSETRVCLRKDQEFDGCSIDITPVIRDTWYYVTLRKLGNDSSLNVEGNLTVDFTVCHESMYCSEPAPSRGDETCFPSPNSSVSSLTAFTSTLLPEPGEFSDAINPEAESAVTVTGEFTEETVIDIGDSTPTPIPLSSASAAADDIDLCPEIDHLSVDYYGGSVSKAFFSSKTNISDMVYTVKNGVPFIASFDLAVDDIGGTLVLRSSIFDEAPPDQNVTSIMCLKRSTPPLWNGRSLDCDRDLMVTSDVSTNRVVFFYYPFPPAGLWHVGLYASCTAWSSSSGSPEPVPCPANMSLVVGVFMEPCVNGCGENGQCQLHTQDGIQMYACSCKNGYVGWGCTDDSQLAFSNYLLKVLLLTLSNLIFLVDALLAIHRRHFPESVSFVATCFFSTMYHACDTDCPTGSCLCITNYNTLQFCDFFASFMSILLILIAMARVPQQLKSFLHIVGVYVLAFFAQWDRFSLWSIAVPLGTGIGILLISWIQKAYKRRKLYPSPRRWLLFIVPGTLLAVAGITFNATLERDDNYHWVHSAWHVCMGLGVLFLMPPRERKSPPCGATGEGLGGLRAEENQSFLDGPVPTQIV